MKIAVVGGGIFGVNIAIRMGKKHDVTLFEKNNNILTAASGINQYRLHRGYHYPRSKETAKSSLFSEISFRKEFKDCIINNYDHYYCIAKEDSLTSPDEYIQFCKENNLEFSIAKLDVLKNENINLCIKVKESLFDPTKLRIQCWKKLNEFKINVKLNTIATWELLNTFDKVIIATYANLNELLENFPKKQTNFQFELCEKPVIKPHSSLLKKSIVIMDGPFMCIDPIGNSEWSVLGNVVHAIHETTIGKFPKFNQDISSLLNKGIIKNPKISNYDKFVESTKKFIPNIVNSQYIGSMFTIRTVLPNIEKTDARPTLVEKISKDIITVFSGKIGNCVAVSEEVEKIIEK